MRNPNWTGPLSWQDIPIMMFTKDEWQLIEATLLSVSAAPIGPGKLGENGQYVFALPPRWIGFTDALGQDEAREIVKTFKALDFMAGWQTYRSEEFGFEVRYPNDGRLQKNDSNIFMYVDREKKLELRIDPMGIAIGFESGTLTSEKISYKLGGLDTRRISYSWSEFSNPEQRLEFIWIEDARFPSSWNRFNEPVVMITYSSPEDKKSLDQILSTFRFVDE